MKEFCEVNYMDSGICEKNGSGICEKNGKCRAIVEMFDVPEEAGDTSELGFPEFTLVRITNPNNMKSIGRFFFRSEAKKILEMFRTNAQGLYGAGSIAQDKSFIPYPYKKKG